MPPLTTSISPSVSFFPDTAAAVQFRGVGFNSKPSYLYTFGNVTPGVAAKPAVGIEGKTGYVAAAPAVEAAFVGLPSAVGNVDMTQEQFDAWPEGDDPEADNEYQIVSLCENLGVTPVK